MITVFYTLKSDIQASDIESRKKIYNIQLTHIAAVFDEKLKDS